MTTTADALQDAALSDDTDAVTCHLDITGMTCASCVRRIEKSLNKIDGVQTAQVNLATEVATVAYDANRVGLDALISAVTAAGYGATHKQEAKDSRPAPPAPGATTRAPPPATASCTG
jgi:Cu+-exporting ATPase